MDVHQQQIAAVGASDSKVAVLGSGAEYVLVPVPQDHEGQRVIDAAFARGWRYVGALGWSGGTLAIHIEDDPGASRPMVLATGAFSKQMATPSVPAPPSGDSAEWLCRLHDIPDTRP